MTITGQALAPAAGETISGQVIDLVGPHGYIHGWIFVGIPGIGQEVYHPQHGRGRVTGDDGKHVTVSFARSGASHSFEASRRDAAETPRLEPRETPGGWRGLGADTGSPISDRAAAYINSIHGHLSPRQLDQYDAGSYKRDTLNPAYRYTSGQAKAIRGYTGASYADINEAARSGSTGKHAADADAISSAMQPLPEDLTVRRELSGAHALGGVKPGDVIADPGFSSATVSPFSRFAGGRHDTTVLHIITPKGTPTVWANPVSDHPEDEMILDRGQPMVVLRAQPRPGRSGVTDVHLLVLPKETVT